MNKPLLLLLLFISFSLTVSAQSDLSDNEMLVKAIELIDAGNMDEAIDVLEEAEKKDPGTYIYAYEIAYAYYLKKDIPKAIKAAERSKEYTDSKADLYQLLGNLYDMTGDSAKALQTYRDGLKLYPDAGRLYLEQGNVYYDRKMYHEALSYYEQGIGVDPMYPSNYYRAALLYLASDEEVWGMMYGELFILLEPNTKRSEVISKKLYDTYKSQITKENDTSISVSFSKAGNVLDAGKMGKKGYRMPFSTFVYEPCILMGAVFQDKLDFEGFCKMRSGALEYFYKQKHDEKYNNVLMAYQKKVKDAGHEEAYNHWILIHGDIDAFREWYGDGVNKSKMEAFAAWFDENPIEINKQNVFVSKDFL